MIRLTLKCDQGHAFESWFQSTGAFDTLTSQGMIECPECTSTKVQKALMAPKVQGTKKSATIGAMPAKTDLRDLEDPSALPAAPPANATVPPVGEREREEAIAKLRKEVEDNSEYVGTNFAQESRAIHSGDAPERAIYGEAGIAEAKALIDDGVPVVPLPFTAKRKMN